MTDEEARALAQQHRGVWWDRRGRKFVAEIYIGGKRKSLGSHLRIESAVAAFEQANAERPCRTRKRKVDAFAQVFAEFKAECEYSTEPGAEEWPEPGQQMTYDGQAFVTTGVKTYRKLNKRTVPVVEWLADCLECGAEFACYVALGEMQARGIVRRCPEHRIKRATRAETPRAPRLVAAQTPDREFPREAIELLPGVCAGLAMVADAVPALDFAAACQAKAPEIRVRWLAVLGKHPPAGVVLDREAGEGGVVRFTG